ncbi:MAG: hypothetical protein Q9195_003870 [Heterodermia aff. obscurata]
MSSKSPAPRPTFDPSGSRPGPPPSALSPTFNFPRDYIYPPFYTLQPTLLTRSAQLRKWSALIQSYCRFHRIYRLSLIDAINTTLFHNASIKKRLRLEDVRVVVTWMAGEEGGRRAEWVDGAGAGKGKTDGGGAVWVWWRRPEEWADVIAGWVEDTGQRGVVLTLWELSQGAGSKGQEFHRMDPEVLQRSLNVLVKRGKAQIFGEEDEQGVKFF